MYTQLMQSTVKQDSVKPGIDLTQKHRLPNAPFTSSEPTRPTVVSRRVGRCEVS